MTRHPSMGLLWGLVLSESIFQLLSSAATESTVTYEYDNYGGTGLTIYAKHFTARSCSRRFLHPFTTRGNAYDIAGNAVSVTTPQVFTGSSLQTATTLFNFTDQFDNGITGKDTYAFPTTITDAEGMTQKRWYHWPVGVLLRSRDKVRSDL